MARPSSLGSPTNFTGSVITRSMRACHATQLVAIEHVVEREHAHDVTHRRERGRHRGADLGERRVAGVERRVLLDQRVQLTDELVELAVGDLGVVVVEVALAVVPDLRRELVGAGRGGRRHVGLVRRLPARSGHPRNLPTRCDGYVVVVGGLVVVVTAAVVVVGTIDVVGATVVGATVVTGGFVVVVVDVLVDVVLDDVVDEIVVVVDGFFPSSSSLSASAAITPISTIASTTSAAISQRIPEDIPPSSSGGVPGGGPPVPPAPPRGSSGARRATRGSRGRHRDRVVAGGAGVGGLVDRRGRDRTRRTRCPCSCGTCARGAGARGLDRCTAVAAHGRAGLERRAADAAIPEVLRWGHLRLQA